MFIAYNNVYVYVFIAYVMFIVYICIVCFLFSVRVKMCFFAFIVLLTVYEHHVCVWLLIMFVCSVHVVVYCSLFMITRLCMFKSMFSFFYVMLPAHVYVNIYVYVVVPGLRLCLDLCLCFLNIHDDFYC